eukprot:3546758-Pleurochrysis_carterae.AAC.1
MIHGEQIHLQGTQPDSNCGLGVRLLPNSAHTTQIGCSQSARNANFEPAPPPWPSWARASVGASSREQSYVDAQRGKLR